jgi:hypothetical protein
LAFELFGREIAPGGRSVAGGSVQVARLGTLVALCCALQPIRLCSCALRTRLVSQECSSPTLCPGKLIRPVGLAERAANVALTIGARLISIGDQLIDLCLSLVALRGRLIAIG